MVDLARVTRVMAGGKRLNFRAAIVIGDKKGRVGYGIAKGPDVQIAISKAVRAAERAGSPYRYQTTDQFLILFISISNQQKYYSSQLLPVLV